jgi:hypothetical protein
MTANLPAPPIRPRLNVFNHDIFRKRWEAKACHISAYMIGHGRIQLQVSPFLSGNILFIYVT